MSFYNRSSGLGGLVRFPGMAGLVRFPGMAGMGALPSFTAPGISQHGQELLDFFLNSTPAGSPYGNIRQIIAKANGVQAAAAPALAHPKGASVKAAAESLEEGIVAGWKALVDKATEVANLTATNPAIKLNELGPRPGPMFPPAWFGDPYKTPEIVKWDDKQKAIVQEMATWTSKMEALNEKFKNGMGPALGAQLLSYIANVGNASAAVQNLIDADLKKDVAQVNADVAKTDSTTLNTTGGNLLALEALNKARQDSINAGIAAAAAAAKLQKSAGASPLMLAAIGVPVLGVLAYVLTRKKGGSVAGYRRRKHR